MTTRPTANIKANTNSFRLLSRSSGDGAHVTLRLLVDIDGKKAIRYVELDRNVLPGRWCRDKSIPGMPPLPPGDWNVVSLRNLSKSKLKPELVFGHSEARRLPCLSETDVWHETRQADGSMTKTVFDYFEFTRLDVDLAGDSASRDRTKVVTHPCFGKQKLVMKIADLREPQQVRDLANESRAYRLVAGKGIAPRFLGHVAEHGDVIGFVVQYIENARQPGRGDLLACLEVLEIFHTETAMVRPGLDLEHFLVRKDGRALLLGLKSAVRATKPVQFAAALMDLEDYWSLRRSDPNW